MTSSFSGGWRMRISLARALFIQPTLLMLDEPTNHLDLRAALWLEEYLMRYKKTLIIVSHDREFLNSVSTDIIHLHDLQLSQYKGDYDSFEGMYEQRRREANKAYEKYEKQLKQAKSSGSKAKAKKVKENTRQKQIKGGKKNRGMGMENADQEGEVSAHPPLLLAPLELRELQVVEMCYVGRDGVEKLTVVGNNDEGLLVAHEVLLEPEGRPEVKVVRGLVQHQQGGLDEERARQADAHAPPAREGARRTPLHRLREAETVQDLGRSRLR